MDNPARIYLDTNAIIHFAENEEISITSLFQHAYAGRAHLVTSELTLAEILVKPLRDDAERLVEGYEELLEGDETLSVLPVDRSVLRRSAELRAVFGGKSHDAIHCATAELAGCAVVVSSDEGLRLPAGMRRVSVEDAASIVRT